MMKNELNLKKLVNSAKNRSHKLTYDEWDFVSENWRKLSPSFLNRFLPYLRWDKILNDMNTEEDFSIIYGALFGLKNPTNKCILKDGWKQGYPRKDWSWYFSLRRTFRESGWYEEPTPWDLYYDALGEVQTWYFERKVPVYYVNRVLDIICNRKNCHAPVGSHRYAYYNGDIVREMILSGSIELNEQAINVFDRLHNTAGWSYYVIYTNTLWEGMFNHDFPCTKVANFINTYIDKIENPNECLAALHGFLPQDTITSLRIRKRLVKRRRKQVC